MTKTTATSGKSAKGIGTRPTIDSDTDTNTSISNDVADRYQRNNMPNR